MFGEADSESPRVASPWTRARSTKPRSSSASTHKLLHIRSQERIARDSANDEEEDISSSLPDSDEEADGFFSLETDLDLNKLDLNAINNKCREQASSSSPSKRWSPTTMSRRLAREPDTLGNLEYKLRLLPATRHRYDRLLTQLKWRLQQGGGYCTYEIGVLDDGRCVGICPTEMRASLRVLASLASELGACLRVRRAFVLAEAQSGIGKLLQSLNNEEARSKLITSFRNGDEEESQIICRCREDREAIVCPEEKMLSSYFETEDINASHSYQVDIEEVVGSLMGGSWLGGSDESEADEEEGEEEEGRTDEFDEDASQANTYSLSLDEVATRTGIDYQQNRPGRRCRYQVKSALHRRRKELILDRRSNAIDEKDKSQWVSPRDVQQISGMVRPRPNQHTVNNGIVQTKNLQHCDQAAIATAAVIAEKTGTAIACERLIVEAIVTRTDDEQEADFIDYASL